MCVPQLLQKRLYDVHHLPKCTSCHEAILVITRRAYYSNDCIYIRVILVVLDFWNLSNTDQFRPLISYIKQNEPRKMHWNLMNDKEIGFLKFFKLKWRRGDQIFQTFWKICYSKNLHPPTLICTNFKTLKKYPWIMRNALKSSEWRLISFHKSFEIEIQKRWPNNWEFLQNFSPQKLSPLL